MTRFKQILSDSPFLYFFLFLIGSAFLTNGCQSEQKPLELVFAFGPDDGGTIKPLIEKFNKEHESINVKWLQTPRSSNEFYNTIVTNLKSGNSEIDIIGTDVIWTPALAATGHVESLSNRFFGDYNPNDFLDASMKSVTYQYNIWGVPWFADAGILYYRKDLLKNAGLEYPPGTWDELIKYSKKFQNAGDVDYGYVFQGANYEGGVTNACEFIWNAEGNILIGDLPVAGSIDGNEFNSEIITIDSDEARRGLSEVRKLAKSGILPPDIANIREFESAQLFRNGKSAFLRSWTSAYGSMLDVNTMIPISSIGLAPLPTSSQTSTSFSCLGGWNLMLNAGSSKTEKDASWEFINFMVSESSQAYRAEKGGILPSLKKLYADEDLLENAPVVDFARQVMPVCRERPRSKFYMEMSPKISTAFSQILTGKVATGEAVERLAGELTDITNTTTIAAK